MKSVFLGAKSFYSDDLDLCFPIRVYFFCMYSAVKYSTLHLNIPPSRWLKPFEDPYKLLIVKFSNLSGWVNMTVDFTSISCPED